MLVNEKYKIAKSSNEYSLLDLISKFFHWENEETVLQLIVIKLLINFFKEKNVLIKYIDMTGLIESLKFTSNEFYHQKFSNYRYELTTTWQIREKFKIINAEKIIEQELTK